MFLFSIEKIFKTNQGLILTPGLGDKAKFIRTGTKIKLIRPDKSELLTKIKGITFEGNHDILIESEINSEEIPIGT